MPIISFIVVLYLFPPCLSDICFHCSCDESSRSVLCTSPSLLIRTVSLLPWVEQIHLVGLNLPHPPHFLFHTGVRVLRINRCGLQELSAHSLLSLPNLEVLNLADNHLETLPTTLFRSLKHLRVVNVAGNRIFNLTPMPWILAENVILEELDLSDNPLSLSTKNTSLPSARQLYLSNSNLEMINSSAVLFQPSTPCPMNESCRYLSLNSLNVSRITTLDLSRNEELTIDISALEAFENISYLDLALNHLPQKFSDWLELRSHVKSLNISHSHLTYDTWSWCGKDLETLDVSGLKLKKMSLGRNCILRSVFARDNLLESIYLEVISLETLHLDRNLFSEWPTLPPGVALENLHILSISSNLISLLPPYALSQFPALQHLDVSKNRLSEIDHQAFPSLGMQLVSIDLSFNQLVLLPHPVLPSLLYLDVSSNNLVTIDPLLFAGFPLLQNLRLANNPSLFSRCETKCWSDSLSELTNLIDLDLSNCALSRSLALSHLQSLRSLILRGNQIISINANDIPAGVRTLDLGENRIYFTSNFSHLKMLRDLRIDTNPLRCDCSLYDIVSHLLNQSQISDPQLYYCYSGTWQYPLLPYLTNIRPCINFTNSFIPVLISVFVFFIIFCCIVLMLIIIYKRYSSTMNHIYKRLSTEIPARL